MNKNSSQLAELEFSWLRGESPPISGHHIAMQLTLQCNDAAIAKLRSLLIIIAEEIDWDDATYRRYFPAWFLANFKPEETEEEAKLRIAIWRNLPDDEKSGFLERAGWSFEQWIYWLHPENRMWHVVRIQCYDGDNKIITILVKDLPTPLKAFTWLLKVIGAVNVQYL